MLEVGPTDGPTAGFLLADLGADVIKVEPVPEGDATRRLPGFGIGFFGYLNRNKRSFVVDLKTADGRALVHRLAADADVVVENYGPGTMERLGCGYEQLAAQNPRLLYLALKGFLAGPVREAAGAGRGGRVHDRPRVHNRAARAAAARRRLGGRHPGRRVRRGRRARGPAGAGADRQGS